MASIDHPKINLSHYSERNVRSDNEAWKHVKIFEKKENYGAHKKVWICKYCEKKYTGNVARVEAHLGGVQGFTIASCSGVVPPEVKKKMHEAATSKKLKAEDNKRKHESQVGNSHLYSLQSGNSGVNPIEGGGSASNSAQPSSVTAAGICSQTVLPGVIRGFAEVYPRAAEKGESSLAISQVSTGLLSDVVYGPKTFGLGNSELNFVGGGSTSDPKQPIFTGISSQTTICGISSGLDVIYPRAAEMDGSSFVNPQVSTGLLSDVVYGPKTFGLGNSELNFVGGGSTSNPKQPIFTGMSPQTTLCGISSGLDVIYPRAAEMDGSSFVNPQERPSSVTPTGISPQTTLHGMTSGSVVVNPQAAEVGGSIFVNPQGCHQLNPPRVAASSGYVAHVKPQVQRTLSTHHTPSSPENVGNAEAYLGNVRDLGDVPVDVGTEMAATANQEKEVKKRKFIATGDNPVTNALGVGDSSLKEETFQLGAAPPFLSVGREHKWLPESLNDLGHWRQSLIEEKKNLEYLNDIYIKRLRNINEKLEKIDGTVRGFMVILRNSRNSVSGNTMSTE